jgi:hypothetical protein
MSGSELKMRRFHGGILPESSALRVVSVPVPSRDNDEPLFSLIPYIRWLRAPDAGGSGRDTSGQV